MDARLGRRIDLRTHIGPTNFYEHKCYTCKPRQTCRMTALICAAPRHLMYSASSRFKMAAGTL